jgi:hypothetical protein
MSDSASDTAKQTTETVIVVDETLSNDKIIENEGNTNEYSKKFDIGGQKVVVVKNEDEIVSGVTHSYCVMGTPEHVCRISKVKLLIKLQTCKNNFLFL